MENTESKEIIVENSVATDVEAINAEENAEIAATETGKENAGSDGDKNENKSEKTNWGKELLSWVIMFIIAYLLAQFITKVIIIKTEIISGSMISTLNVGDRVLGNRMAYWFDDPERGDVVFFAFPDDESKTYVKRVIGLPGETVHIRNGKVYINDSTIPLDEPYLREEMEPEPDASFEIPEGCFFVMGDNRNVSADARYWNTKYVTKKQLYAKAVFRYKPTFDKITSATY